MNTPLFEGKFRTLDLKVEVCSLEHIQSAFVPARPIQSDELEFEIHAPHH